MSKNDGYSKGDDIFRKKSSAQEAAEYARNRGVPSRIVTLANGYRVDRKWTGRG